MDAREVNRIDWSKFHILFDDNGNPQPDHDLFHKWECWSDKANFVKPRGMIKEELIRRGHASYFDRINGLFSISDNCRQRQNTIII